MNSNFRFIDKRTAIVTGTEDHSYQLKFESDEAYDYFNAPGCTCRMIVIEKMGSIIIGGSDNCPVHSFGE